MWAKIKPYVISILIPLGVGIFSSLFTRGNMDIYSTINVPPLAPPSILFPIVWTILYILMGVSSGMIYTSGQKSGRALTIYGISLFVNFLWSIIFFNLKAFLFAFIWLVLLIFLVAFTIVEYLKINKVAAYLQIPYLLWVAFAGYLSFGIFLLN
ncbi:MAG: tryptophan-rich sensory protein [Clostridia bacterium]|nr:tryptophan-rich sensory protein [Clostridia bacterium]